MPPGGWRFAIEPPNLGSGFWLPAVGVHCCWLSLLNLIIVGYLGSCILISNHQADYGLVMIVDPGGLPPPRTPRDRWLIGPPYGLWIRGDQRITDYSRPGGNLEVAIGRVREHGEAVREGW